MKQHEYIVKNRSLKLEFYEECASQWYDRLNADEKATHQQLINDLIYKPHQFADRYTKNEYNIRQERLEKANALVPAESLYTMDNYIARTFYDATPMRQFLEPVTVPSFAQESKVYSGSDLGTAKLVGAHGSWSDPPMIGMSLTPAFIKALGVHAGFQLNFAEIDEAGLYDIEWYHALKTAEKVGTLFDQKLCLGEGAEDAEVDTTNVNGVHNYTSLQTANFGDGDNDVTTQGDIRKGLFNALASLLSVKEPGDIYIISTSGYASEPFLQLDSYGVSDMQVLRRDLLETGIIKGWLIDNNIEADTNAVATQRAMLLKISPNTIKHEVVYPFQSKMMAKEFPDDIKEMLMEMSIYKMYNANAGVICSGDITASTAGFIQNGRIW